MPVPSTPEHLRAVADDAVDPHLGDGELVVVVDIEMAAAAQRQRSL